MTRCKSLAGGSLRNGAWFGTPLGPRAGCGLIRSEDIIWETVVRDLPQVLATLQGDQQ